VNQHYFSESPQGDFQPREIEVDLAGAPRRLVTAGGVFSPEHLDQGTRLLITELEGRDSEESSDRPAGPILDVGCGWGPIALAAAILNPDREVWAVDVNERALELTSMNADRLGLENLRAVNPDEIPETICFSSVRSNPPIRVGKDALHAILRTWIPRVEPGGTATFVVAKHLGAESLQRWIALEFPEFEVSRIGRARGFHLIEAAR